MLRGMKRIFQNLSVSIIGVVFSCATVAVPAFVSAQSSANGRAYVALGDSVAAGYGLTPGTSPSTEDTACGRSVDAYPYVVAAKFKLNLTHLACAGAEADDFYNPQNENNLYVAPQIDAAFANGKPDVITITVGANDLHWNEFVHQCYVTNCGGEASSASAKVARGILRAQLFKALNRIDTLSYGRPPKIYVTGYFAPYGSQVCADTQGLDASERLWLNSQTKQLNQAIRSVTQWFDSTTYVPISFVGHELCSTSPWIQGLQAAQPYHPTAAGQQAIARSLISAMRSDY